MIYFDVDALAEAIRFYRQKAGLTQIDAAGLLETMQGNISDMERARNTPTLETLDKICVAYDTTPLKLFNKMAKIEANSR